jgi:hypothetical protein
VEKFFRILAALMMSTLLSACGGGDEDNRIFASALRVFSDGSGIGRWDTNLFYVENISRVIQSVNEGEETDTGLRLPDDTNMPVVSTHPYSTLRRGVATLAGDSFNVALLLDNRSDETGAVYFELPGASDMILVSGLKPVNVPVVGTYRYLGTQTANARAALAPDQIGTFQLDIDFASGTFTYSGQTATFSATASGTIDRVSGLFASSNVTITANGQPYAGHFYGQVHAEGATRATGIIVTADPQPDYSASFVGLR